MDLGAFSKIDRLAKIAADNGIYVPRLRGYRLMSEEEPTGEYGYQYDIYDSYCGCLDVLYVHARIGGGNWEYFKDDITGELLTRVDDELDSTYCDLYFKITPVSE